MITIKTMSAALFAVLSLPIHCLATNPEDFTVKAAFGEGSFTLSEHRGKVVALHFLLKTECPVCLRHTHDYAALAATTPGVIHVFLKPDSADEIEAWAEKINKNDLAALPAIYRDPEARLAGKYDIPDGYLFHGETIHYPGLVVLDAGGAELFRYIGKNNSDRLATADFTSLLAQKMAKTGN